MTTGSTLQDKLARSLDKANSKAVKVQMKPDKVASPGGIFIPSKTVFKRRKPTADGCTKLSVSLFQTDIERLQAIRAYMAQQGEILSTSQAVKLALRAAPIDSKLMRLLEDIRNEDGR